MEAAAEIVTRGDAALKAITEQPPDLVIPDLNLPVIGGPDLLWASLGAVIFASLGVGFLISTLSRNENQAVQMAMMTTIWMLTLIWTTIGTAKPC